MRDATLTELMKSLPVGIFKPCAYYTMGEVKVVTKDCSYSAQRINGWLNVHWENHRPWYKPWKKCVGFSVYYPTTVLGLHGEVPVTDVLSRVVKRAGMEEVFGKYNRLIYRMAKNLKIQLPE